MKTIRDINQSWESLQTRLTEFGAVKVDEHGRPHPKLSAHCPAHKDKHASLNAYLRPGKDGKGPRITFVCHAGCTHDAVSAALGLSWRELVGDTDAYLEAPGRTRRASAKTSPPKRAEASEEKLQQMPQSPASPLTAPQHPYKAPEKRDGLTHYIYKTPQGEPSGLCKVKKIAADGSKKMWWESYNSAKGQWETTGTGIYKGLYGAEHHKDWPTNGPLFVVEGEKDVEALRWIGLKATSTMNGAKKEAEPYWDEACSLMRGCDVIIIPDADEQGIDHAKALEKTILKHKPKSIKRVSLGFIHGSKKDVSDYIKEEIKKREAKGMIIEISKLKIAYTLTHLPAIAPDPSERPEWRYYPYTKEDGEPANLRKVYRSKTSQKSHWESREWGTDAWEMTHNGYKGIYGIQNRHAWRAGDPVYFVRDEATVDALALLGIDAVCAPEWPKEVPDKHWLTGLKPLSGLDVKIMSDTHRASPAHNKALALVLARLEARAVYIAHIPREGGLLELVKELRKKICPEVPADQSPPEQKTAAIAWDIKETPLCKTSPSGPSDDFFDEEAFLIDPDTHVTGTDLLPRSPSLTGTNWPVASLLPVGGRLMIYGLPKVGKSRLGMQLAVCIAGGYPFLDLFPCAPQRVIYISSEEDPAVLSERGLHIANHFVEQGHSLFPKNSLLHRRGIDAIDDGLEKRLELYYHKFGVRAVVFDLFQELKGETKGDNAYDLGAKILKVFTKDYHERFPQLSFVFVHHATKAATHENPAIGASGGASITGGMISNIQLSAIPEGSFPEAQPDPAELESPDKKQKKEKEGKLLDHKWAGDNPMERNGFGSIKLFRMALSAREAPDGDFYIKHCTGALGDSYFEIDPDSFLEYSKRQGEGLSVKQAMLAAFIHHYTQNVGTIKLSEAAKELEFSPRETRTYSDALKAKGLLEVGQNKWHVQTTSAYAALRRAKALVAKTREGDATTVISRSKWEKIFPELVKAPPPRVRLVD